MADRTNDSAIAKDAMQRLDNQEGDSVRFSAQLLSLMMTT
jgi:hypothetical protein